MIYKLTLKILNFKIYIISGLDKYYNAHLIKNKVSLFIL